MSQTPVAPAQHLTAEVRDFQDQGFVVFESVFDAATVEQWHRIREALVINHQFIAGSDEAPEAIGDLVERVPEIALPVVTHPVLFGFAEAVMGPMLQLDSTVLMSSPVVDTSMLDVPVCWHRDRFGYLPTGDTYHRPAAIMMISYMQDLTLEVGPLRVIPRSHIQGITMDNLNERHQDELLLHLRVGSVVAMHHNLLHSGTKNVSLFERRFLGWTYNLSAYTHEDNYQGPNCKQLRNKAFTNHDRRLMRLLGDDDLIFPRQNSGFTEPHEASWARWLQEDEEFSRKA